METSTLKSSKGPQRRAVPVFIPLPPNARECNPKDYIVPGILQARILEWVAFPFSRGSSQIRDQTQVSRIVGFFTS